MVHKIYTVYDSKAETYLPPFFMRSKGEALRAWIQAVNDEQTQFNKYPADFTMFELGEFDDVTGVINNHLAKQSLGNALEFRKTMDVSPVTSIKEQ